MGMNGNNEPRIILAIADSKVGGGQAVVLRLAKYLNDNEDILVLCPKGNLYERLLESGIPVSETNFGLMNVLSIRRKLAILGNITINTHLLGTTFWTALSLLFNNKVKVVATLLNPIIYENITVVKKVFFPVIIKLLSLKIKMFVGVSEDICASIKIYTDNIPIHYLPTSINVDDFPYCGVDISKSNYKIAIVGRLSYAKGHKYFISAANLICNIRSDIVFYIIGDGELKEELKKKVDKLNLTSKFIFTGYLKDMKPVLRTVDIVIMPSLFEGIPCLLLEIMSMGIPVIASAVGGIPSVITSGHNGILVSPRNEKEICYEVIKLLEDKVLRKNISLNARTLIENDYNSDIVYKDYTNILNIEK